MHYTEHATAEGYDDLIASLNDTPDVSAVVLQRPFLTDDTLPGVAISRAKDIERFNNGEESPLLDVVLAKAVQDRNIIKPGFNIYGRGFSVPGGYGCKSSEEASTAVAVVDNEYALPVKEHLVIDLSFDFGTQRGAFKATAAQEEILGVRPLIFEELFERFSTWGAESPVC